MSESTKVPLQPIGEGTLTRLWLGLSAAALLGAGIAWAGTSATRGSACSARDFGGLKGAVASPTGLMMVTRKPGTGPTPTDADITLVNYKGALRDGKVFDAAQRTPLPVKGMIAGFSEALKRMQRGGSYRFCIPSALGYGATAAGPIPANSVLMFDVDLLDFRSEAEIRALQAQMQAIQAQRQGAAPVPPATPPQ